MERSNTLSIGLCGDPRTYLPNIELNTLIHRRYTLLQFKERRTFATAYEAWDNKRKRQIEAAVVHRNLIQQSEEQRRLLICQRKAMRLKQSGFQPVIDVCEHGGLLLVMTEASPGISLEQLMSQTSENPATRLAVIGPILLKVAAALEHLHVQGWHGLVDPRAIWVDGEAMQIQQALMLKGLPKRPAIQIIQRDSAYAYMLAPELRWTGSVDERVDIYSMGALLAWALPAASGAIEQLIREASADAPDDRLPAMREFSKRLALVLKPDMGHVSTLPFVFSQAVVRGNDEKPTKKYTGIWSMLALSVVVAVLVFVVAYLVGR